MNKTLGGIFVRARKLESAIAARVEGHARSASGAVPAQPLEIVHAIVHAVEGHIQPVGRGRRGVPFNHVHVVLAAATPTDHARFELVFAGPPPLEQRIADRLRAAGCDVTDFSTSFDFVESGRAEWERPEFHIEYSRQAPAPVVDSAAPRLELVVTNGTAERSAYVFVGGLVGLGRGAEVRDARQRLIRTNHVAFAEDGTDVNQSVSRRHARIEHDRAAATYRLFDDGSAQGTTVIRGGRGHVVQRGTKGMVIQPGDEIVVGEARVRVTACRG